MNSIKKKNFSKAGLFLATFIWGISFVIMKNVLSSIPPLYILAIRFCGAALILLPICIGKLKNLNKSYLLGGALMGAALALGYVSQTYGLRQTTPGKNAFLTSAYCVMVPFLYWAFNKRYSPQGRALNPAPTARLRGRAPRYLPFDVVTRSVMSRKRDATLASFDNKKRPDRYNITAAFVCLVGIGLISLDGDLRVGTGDALTILCGFFYANHIVMTARFIDGRDPVALAMLQFAFVGITALLAAFIFEPFPTHVPTSDVWSIVFLTVVSTAICLLLQVFGQKYTPPSQASVIMTLESVFGAVSSHIIFNEAFSLRLILGFALTLAAVIISETKLAFIRTNRAGDSL